ncbi:GNAT family N-acetyltransferase [Georgenia alba]|uniref:GNAT family N-acetyltransferase n=1 Tax=Georgenia alba TaxID=2233858 RepID=A0ABW2Q9B4_9MICO
MPDPTTSSPDQALAEPRAPLAVRAAAPETLPDLPEEAGLTWRPLEPADIPALTALITHIEDVDNPPYRTAPEEVAGYFDDSHDHSGVGGFDAEGNLHAFGLARLRKADTTVKRVFVSGGLEPTRRNHGIGRAVMDWQIARARQMLSVADGADTEVPARIVVHVDDDMDGLAHLVSLRGFAPRRHYSQLRRDLSEPIPEVSLAHPLTVVPWSPALDDAVRRAHNAAFRELWGAQPLSVAAWQEERSHHVATWSFVALDRSSDRAQVAGYLMSGRYEQDWDALGWTEGYTEILGVLPAWRGRHVATALLSHAMRAYAEDGMQYAGLDVDADDPTGAIGLFERLGYERVRGSAVYTIEI